MNINNQNFLNSIMSNILAKNSENISDKMIDENMDKMVNTNTNKVNLPNIDEQIKLLLTTLNEAPNKENTELLKMLIQNNLPMSKENIETLIKGNKFFTDFPIEKAIFMIQNKLKPNLDNFLILEKFISNESSIKDNIQNIISDIINNNDINFKLEDIFKNTSFESDLKQNNEILNDIKENIMSNKNLDTILNDLLKDINPKIDNKQEFFKNVLDSILSEKNLINSNKNEILKAIFNTNDKNEINNLINELNNKNSLKENLQNLKEPFLLLQKEIILSLKENKNHSDNLKNIFEKNFLNLKKLQFFDFENSSSKELESFFEDLKSVSNNLKQILPSSVESSNTSLNKHIENLGKTIDFMSNLNNTTFLQIPININNLETNMDLYIFNNKKNSKNKDKDSSGSALLALNLANLGKIEVYITKIKNDINCQFRLSDEIFKPLIKSNVSLLGKILKEKNLQLKEVVFKSLNESYNLITDNISSTKVNSSIQISNFNAKA